MENFCDWLPLKRSQYCYKYSRSGQIWALHLGRKILILCWPLIIKWRVIHISMNGLGNMKPTATEASEVNGTLRCSCIRLPIWLCDTWLIPHSSQMLCGMHLLKRRKEIGREHEKTDWNSIVSPCIMNAYSAKRLTAVVLSKNMVT